MGLRELLIPHDKIYFDMFEKQAGVMKEAAWQLVALTEDFTNVKEKRHEIEKLEHKGDQITHDIYKQLNTSFITPLDPERSHSLPPPLTKYWTISMVQPKRCITTISAPLMHI